MKRIIHVEYEKSELNKYKPQKFEDYLINQLAELRVNQALYLDDALSFYEKYNKIIKTDWFKNAYNNKYLK